MHPDEFEALVDGEFSNAIPEKFRDKIKNVAFLVEDEPSREIRKREELGPNETLLGYYHGVPATARGDGYGIGPTMPDTITLYQHPIEDEARVVSHHLGLAYEPSIRKVVRDTIWHEVAHHFGYDEHQVRTKEGKRGAEK